jgi:hypothetical protein
VQWCVPPINVLPTDCQPFPVTVFFLLASISSTREMRCPLPFATFRSYPGDVHISPWRAMSRLSLRRPRGVYLLSTTPTRSKSHPHVQPSPGAPGPLDPTALPETEPALAGSQTVRAMLNAGWPALLAAHSFFLTTSLSIFGDILGALQTPARAAGCLALPTPRDAFLTALALPPLARVVAVLDEPQQASSELRSPASLEGLTLGLAGTVGGGAAPQLPGLSPRNLAGLRALVVAALFLARMPGSS